MADTEGVATSITLSASSASLSRVRDSSVEANTMRTLAGRRWRKSSRRNVPSLSGAPVLSPNSCCILRSSCVGLRSLNSSVLKSCWSLRCSEAAVRLISCVFRVS